MIELHIHCGALLHAVSAGDDANTTFHIRAGENEIELDLIARGKAIPAGSVGTNRWIDVNHHLSFVADEVDKLDEAPVRSATRQGVV